MTTHSAQRAHPEGAAWRDRAIAAARALRLCWLAGLCAALLATSVSAAPLGTAAPEGVTPRNATQPPRDGGDDEVAVAVSDEALPVDTGDGADLAGAANASEDVFVEPAPRLVRRRDGRAPDGQDGPYRWPPDLSERILAFFSDVKVEQDGSLLVTESIDAVAAMREIKRGLQRDFPTVYHRPDGTRVVVGFDVLNVWRDGKPEQFALIRLNNGVRVRIGQAERLLDPGVHRFVIRYRTTRQLGFYPDFDELYWNATGNGWTLPIERAAVRISLPAGVPIRRTAYYTGPAGAHGADAAVRETAPGTVRFATTAALAPGEGLTVAASWQKGLILPPSRAQALRDFVQDNLTLVAGAMLFVFLAGYYLVLWLGRRRRTPGTVVPRFEPPAGVSAAGIRYIRIQRYDEPTFVSAMLDLIATGRMRMVKTARAERGRKSRRAVPQDSTMKTAESMALEAERASAERGGRRDGSDEQKTDAAGGEHEPSAGDSDQKVVFEKLAARRARPDPVLDALCKTLFRERASFDREGDRGRTIGRALTALPDLLKEQHDHLLRPARQPARRGAWLWFAWLLLTMYLLYRDEGASGVWVAMPFAAFTVMLLANLLFHLVDRRFSFALAFWTIFALIPCSGGLLALGHLVFGGGNWLQGAAGLFPLAMLPVVMRGFRFLQSYTPAGFVVRDEIDGFRRFLTVAEAPRIAMLNTVEEKLALYERFLPYAVALDVGKAWSEKFALLFADPFAGEAIASMQSRYGDHQMSSPQAMSGAGLRNLSNDLGPVNVSTSSSSDSPGSSSSWSGSSDSSSSSGSSGGGSSGGGGGGGGGSGW